MNRNRQRQRGMALLLVLLTLVIIAGAAGIVLQRVNVAKQRSDAAVDEARLDELCKAAIDIGVQRLWNGYITGNGNTTGNLASYRVFINNVAANNEDLNGNRVQDAGEPDADGNGVFAIGAPTVFIDAANAQSLPGSGRITGLSVSRTDDLTGTLLTLQATAQVGVRTRTVTQTVRVSGQLFRGFEYCVLANNINCIICHAEFQPIDLAMNQNKDLYGSFDRIKVGALESLMVRTGKDAFAANSTVAGTTYTRGTVYDQDARALSAANLASSTFDANAFSNLNGKLTQGNSGHLTNTNLINATFNANGELNQFANLYLNYPTNSKAMTDGEMPTSFPAPFSDDNGNRVVDVAEFDKVTKAASGSITGGTAYGVPSGQVYTGTALPNSSNAAQADVADGKYSGNLILTGTAANPISIDGKIAIDGDLVISGKVKGWGQIQVKGNVYVVGDTTYADAPGQFGMAADGTRNGMALVAGGNILIGDYLTRSGLDKKSQSGVLDEYQIEVNVRNKVTGGDKKDIGYFGANVSDPGFTANGESQTSFTTSELMQFNQMEYTKAQKDPKYKPRYYRIRPSQPIYRNTGADQCAFYYTDTGIRTIATNSSTTILNLSPTNSWLSETQLREIWWNDEMSRPSSSRPFQVDGLLYSNNAIFALVRSNIRHRSNAFGELVLRGSMVCPDLGILAPGGNDSVSRVALQFLYDRRVNNFFQIEDTTQASFTRLVYRDN